VHNFSYYVYFFSLHVSGDYVPTIRRNNCIYATLGTRYSCFFWWWAHSRLKHVEKRNTQRKTVHRVSFIKKFLCFSHVIFSCFGCYFHQQSMLVVFIFDYFVLIESSLYFIIRYLELQTHFNFLYFIFIFYCPVSWIADIF